jgi:hypothetical protein
VTKGTFTLNGKAKPCYFVSEFKVNVPLVTLGYKLRSKKSRMVFQPWMPVSRKVSAPCLLPG